MDADMNAGLEAGLGGLVRGPAAVAGQFRRWQGLRWMPFGLGALLAAALLAGGAGSTGTLSTVASVLALSALVVDRWVDEYYRREFGQVRDLPFRRWGGVAARYGAAVVVGGAIALDLLIRPPVLVSGLVIGGAMVGFWWLSGAGRRAWPVLAPIPIVLALLPLTPAIDVGRPAVAVLLLGTGLAEIAGGVLDHRMLTRRIREVRGALQG